MFPSDIDYETKITLETEMTPLAEEPPFHILLLGDWSGRESRSVISPPKYQPIEIDRDNFDDVIRKLDVSLNLNFSDNGKNIVTIAFNELEDFHPDKMFQRLSIFDNLRDVRRRLLNANTFESAADEVRSWFIEESNQASDTKQQNIHSEAEQTAPDDLLDQILGKSVEPTSNLQEKSDSSAELSNFVRNIVKPHLIHTDTVEQSKLLIIVDEVISDLMRKILHHPQFQALEAAWRGAFFLVKRVETDAKLKIYLMDISKNELANSLKSVDNLTNSHFYKGLANIQDSSNNKSGWSVICGNYSFFLNVDDIATLIRLAKIAKSKNLPFISHLNPEAFGVKSFNLVEEFGDWEIKESSPEGKLWSTLRSVPETAHLGLALPRFLIRLPYGNQTEPTETFSFEEFTNSVEHEYYLWANPAFACTLLLAQTFGDYGWSISDNLFQDIENLSLHFLKDEHQNTTKPCAEITLTESNYIQILEQGLIPLISYKNTDRITIGRLQSVAFPPTVLKGSWM